MKKEVEILDVKKKIKYQKRRQNFSKDYQCKHSKNLKLCALTLLFNNKATNLQINSAILLMNLQKKMSLKINKQFSILLHHLSKT